MFNREEVIAKLSTGVILISFMKVNGELRDMYATTNEDIIKQMDLIPDGSTTYPDNQIRVIDYDLEEWRSFVFENLVTIEGLEPE